MRELSRSTASTKERGEMSFSSRTVPSCGGGGGGQRERGVGERGRERNVTWKYSSCNTFKSTNLQALKFFLL